MSLGVWNVYFGPIGINISIVLLGLFVLALATIKKLRGKETKLFEVSYLLLLVGFLYFTLHGKLLLLPFPVSIPEKPLVDNNLTFNYALTSLLTFIIFPVLLVALLRNDASSKSLGLRVRDLNQTATYTLLGVIISIALFLLSNTLFGFVWIPEYTVEGLALWIPLVSILSVFAQAFFFIGMLFNKHLDHENGVLLVIVSILAFQMFISSTLCWMISNIISSIAKIVITWKTRNIYGAALMSITTNLVDIFVQII